MDRSNWVILSVLTLSALLVFGGVTHWKRLTRFPLDVKMEVVSEEEKIWLLVNGTKIRQCGVPEITRWSKSKDGRLELIESIKGVDSEVGPIKFKIPLPIDREFEGWVITSVVYLGDCVGQKSKSYSVEVR